MRYWILLIPTLAFADINTTGNLITNPGFNDGTTGWSLSGDAQRIGDCCPGGHDLEFGDYGSIEQSFNLINDTITQPMLNNGITLNSSVEVQNGEGGVGSWAPNRGGADTFTIRLQIRDANNDVLATTTQERTNVTGINGKDFSDSVTYTGSDSNIGNIFISGSDANAPANLGGPNVDNISVTMTYDDTVLTVEQTAILNTAFEEIEEVLATNVEPQELFLYEEVIVEEFIPFEEPVIATEMFSEIYVQEVAVEEINTGIVNIFQEVTYEEPTTIETFTAEIESFEEIVEVTESPNIETTAEAIQGGEEVLGNTTELVGRNESESGESEAGVPEESTVANREQPTEQVAEETETSPEPTETETVVASAEVVDEAGGATEENEINGEGEAGASRDGDDGTETDARAEEDVESGNQEMEEGGNRQATRGDNQVISIEAIRERVNATVKEVDQRLVATSMIVAKAMQNNSTVDSYASKNTQIFDSQPQMSGGDYFETRNYIDARNIYAEVTYGNNDVVQQYQKKLQEATDNTIRAQEHLRRIRGY